MGNFLRTLTREEKKDKFIKQKMKEWIQTHPGPLSPQEREKLEEQFTYEYFSRTGSENTDGFRRQLHLQF